MSKDSSGSFWPWQETTDSQRVRIEEIIRDERLQPRVDLVPALVARYVNSMQTGSQFPPVTLARIKGKKKLHLICGWHRFEAATLKLGAEAVQAVVLDIAFNEARWIAAKDNLQNGHAYTQRGDNRRVFKAYMHAKKNVKSCGNFKSYREIEGETQIKKSSLHNWMKDDFPSVAAKMGEEKAGNVDAGAPDVDDRSELLRAIERGSNELVLYVGKLSDPEDRWRAVEDILLAVERMKKGPMEEPEFH